MTNPMIKIVNAESGEEIERAMTAAEFKAYEIDQKASAAQITERENKSAAKAALLERLGITADEAALLLS